MRNTLAAIIAFASAALAHAQPVPAAAASQGVSSAREIADSALGRCVRSAPRYPVEALRLELSGRTVVGFRVTTEGGIEGPMLRHSSGHDVLDRAALAHLDRCIARFRATEQPRLPPGSFALPLLWRID
ncbi:TonB family protein [Rubrivivax sp. RP6-9]|uniref:TonB family protein n=1 Tax=Rubrivivax sp. RP6-9 TaxID=3415750 RepID=UPI003CC67CB9